jgi:hypothetical protein
MEMTMPIIKSAALAGLVALTALTAASPSFAYDPVAAERARERSAYDKGELKRDRVDANNDAKAYNYFDKLERKAEQKGDWAKAREYAQREKAYQTDYWNKQKEIQRDQFKVGFDKRRCHAQGTSC